MLVLISPIVIKQVSPSYIRRRKINCLLVPQQTSLVISLYANSICSGKNGRKGSNCSFPCLNMCFCFIRGGIIYGNKGSSGQYAHPKLNKASLTRKRCDRRNCYYNNVAGTSHPLTDIPPTQYNNESVSVHRQFNSPPLTQMDVNHLFNSLPFSTLPHMFLSCLQTKSFYTPGSSTSCSS